MLEISCNYDAMINGAVNSGVTYLRDNPNIKSLVLGVSGGVDSAVIAFLARRICDILYKEGRSVALNGYSLQIMGNKKDEAERANAVGETYCDFFTTTNLDETYLNILSGVDYNLYAKQTMHPEELSHKDKIRLGNMKARTRMIFLYNKAQDQEGLVLSTDNLTEYHLGFWTLHGDVGDLGLIQELWKTEVYGIANLVGGVLASCANAIPTDGLGVTNSDIDQLLPNWNEKNGDYQAAYKLVDTVLIDYLTQLGSFDSTHPVVQRCKATNFKRNNPVNVKREVLLWNFNSCI